MRQQNPVPPSQKVVSDRLENATALYQDFTGHEAPHVYTFPEKHNEGLIGLRVGPLDYIGLELQNGRRVFIDMRGEGQPDLGATHDGARLIIAGGDQARIIRGIREKFFKGASKTIALGTIFALAYSTQRDGKREKYVHQFATPSRPRLVVRSNGLAVTGGRYVFLDSGINDR